MTTIERFKARAMSRKRNGIYLAAFWPSVLGIGRAELRRAAAALWVALVGHCWQRSILFPLDHHYFPGKKYIPALLSA